MNNSYFICTQQTVKLDLERFHICTWEFNDNKSLIEFGCEIKSNCLTDLQKINIELHIPWLEHSCLLKDFYDKLKESENSRFIFNNSIIRTTILDGNSNQNGVVHEFSAGNKLCILPIKLSSDIIDKKLNIETNLTDYQYLTDKPNVYIRFALVTKISSISIRKNGISKSTFIYDIKVNERRNFSNQISEKLKNKNFCKIDSCLCLNIVPNNSDIAFFESQHLKKVRSLEYIPFRHYLGDNRIKKDNLMVVVHEKNEGTSYSFFTIFSKERIGRGQFALAILINVFCGILLFIPTYRKSLGPNVNTSYIFENLPKELFVAIIIIVLTCFYFIWPWISTQYFAIKSLIIIKLTKEA